MIEAKKGRRCFISAAYGTDLTTLQRVLDRLEVAWEWASSGSPDEPILLSVVSAIKRCDFVIGVLQQDRPAENVLFEIGISVGLARPRLLLRVGTVDLPTELGTTVVFETELRNRELLEFQVDLFSRSLEGRSNRPRKTGSAALIKKSSQDISAPALFGSALEQSVAAAIVEGGGRVTVPMRVENERNPDLLMWMPQLDSQLFNPAAIEVVGTKSSSDISVLQLQFAGFLRSSGVRCGLIIVNSQSHEKDLQNLSPIPWIFVLTLSEFKSKLKSGELGLWAKHERNRMAHGVR